MKKSITLFAIALTAILVSTNSYAQVADNRKIDLEKSYSNSEMPTLSINHEGKRVYRVFSFDLSSSNIKVDPSFGSFIIPNTNYLRMVATDGGVYNRAELINKKSGDILFKVPIKSTMNTVDMTGTEPGTYRLILSDDVGNKYEEDITIL